MIHPGKIIFSLRLSSLSNSGHVFEQTLSERPPALEVLPHNAHHYTRLAESATLTLGFAGLDAQCKKKASDFRACYGDGLKLRNA